MKLASMKRIDSSLNPKLLTGQQSWWISWWAGPFCRALSTAAPRSSPTAGFHCSAAAAALAPPCGDRWHGDWRWNKPALAAKEQTLVSWTEECIIPDIGSSELWPRQDTFQSHYVMNTPAVWQTSCTESKMLQSKLVRATATSHVFRLSIRAVLCCSSELSVNGFWWQEISNKPAHN